MDVSVRQRAALLPEAPPLLLLLLISVAKIRSVSSSTDPSDKHAAELGKTDDPCGNPWEGVICNNSRVTRLSLSSMGLKGTLSGDIGQLTELRSLDLSYNKDLGGPITKSIGNLKKITTLILAACSFSGSIPSEIGDLEDLLYLALNNNNLTGIIPPSFGKLSNLYWFDIAENQLTGPIPVSSGSTPGLDQLLQVRHFHFNNNQLSRTISENLFSSNMTLIHIRLDRNGLTGPVPSGIGTLTALRELNLSNNRLTGKMPDLSGLNIVNYVDLSNNSFSTSEAPAWLGKLQSLTALVIQSGNLTGAVPSALFGFPQLQEVASPLTLGSGNNSFNGSLNLGSNISPQLQVVDFRNNNISGISFKSQYGNTLKLMGNPICNAQNSGSSYCQQQFHHTPYTTSLSHCGSSTCPEDQSFSPNNCECAFPYVGTLIFRGLFFRDLSNRTRFQDLETSLWTELHLANGAVSLQNPFFDSDSYLRVQLRLFPVDRPYFNRSEVMRIGFQLSYQTYKPPPEWGPYLFVALPYVFQAEEGGDGKTSIGKGVVAGIAAASAILVIGLIFLASCGGAPKLKGARFFSFDELKRSTNGFSEANEIGSGSYGKVYRGVLPCGQIVAIKRAQQGSTQGAHEFRTEIELLSRVHHRNLVRLVGFCFDQSEQMLVYEYIPNGTLRESLSGKSGIQLNWNRRLRVALGSARGLAYLHALADPPIIHRDVKTSNIILDEDVTAKVADFGLSKLISDIEKSHVSTQVKGTLGYLDPEYFMTQQLTDRSDVYSFGVVMLELITGKVPIERGRHIVRDIRVAMNSQDRELCGLRDYIDPLLLSSPALPGFARFVGLAMRCVEVSAAARPTMNVVVKEIESILQDEGMNTDYTSAASSARDFSVARVGTAAVPRQPYGDAVVRKEVSSDSFDYSGRYALPTRVEPK
ncbi:unnamed protein product [Spirodela intermedia]|uniref:non-specific serine/threonine protein kinase n=1 Tax=Spirodela intermedia TaxID=51605 RepID=A0A7I8JZ00_SPIIN|nr:unnamed protein product [Spirodela intermedia]